MYNRLGKNRSSFFLFFVSLCLILGGCSSKNSNPNSNEDTFSGVNDFVETLNSSQLIQLILIEVSYDYNIISSSFLCSPHSLQRISNGRTILTAQGEEALRRITKELLLTKSSKRKKILSDSESLRERISKDFFNNELEESRDLERFSTTIDLLWEELD